MIISELFQYLIVPMVAIGSCAYCLMRARAEWRNNPRSEGGAGLLVIGGVLSFIIGMFFWPGDVVKWFLGDVIIANIGYSILSIAMVAVPCIYRQRHRNTPSRT